MRIERRHLHLDTSRETEILDLTPEVQRFVVDAGLETGFVLVFTPGSTASVTTLEFESGAVEDLRRAVERLAPRGETYQHDLRWHDGNGYAHVRSALLGPSITVPVVDGALELGTWQQIVLLDFDNRPRRRKVVLQSWGE